MQKFVFLIFGILVPSLISLYIIQLKFQVTRTISRTIVATDIKINPPKNLSPLSTSGRYIVNQKGEKIIFRGVNLVGFSPNDWNYFPKAIDYLANNYQINIIRIRLFEEEFIKDKNSFFDNLEGNFLNPAQKQNLYVILSLKPIDTTYDLGDSRTEALWQAVANRYKYRTDLIYDLLPEPHDTTFAYIIPRYKKLIEIVRAEKPDSLIFVSGENWGREINYFSQNPLPYQNIVYRTNPYNESVYFPQQFGEIIKTQPVFIGEFGADGKPYMSREAVSELINLAKTYDVGWTAWNFYDTGCPCILSNRQNYTLSPYGQIIKDNL